MFRNGNSVNKVLTAAEVDQPKPSRKQYFTCSVLEVIQSSSNFFFEISGLHFHLTHSDELAARE